MVVVIGDEREKGGVNSDGLWCEDEGRRKDVVVLIGDEEREKGGVYSDGMW